MTTDLTFQHAEIHDHYMPRGLDPEVIEMNQIAARINKLKVEDPESGEKVHDGLIDQLVRQARKMTRFQDEEPLDWSGPERCLWRSSELSPERKFEIIEKAPTATDMTAYAVANQGRWLVTCPLPGCNGAQYASVRDPRFWCVDCDNRAANGQWLPVIWPDNPSEIEDVLTTRPKSARNWLPGETVSDLRQQDLEQMESE
jgi:hypothetical protein